VTVRARHVVLCAGAIETTRLLLLLDRQFDNRIFAGCEVLGRYFHDHVSMRVADIDARRPRELNRLAGFRFLGSTMRSLRFELAPRAQKEEGVGSAFGHISFTADGQSGFEALRQFLRALQRKGSIDVHAGLKVLRDMPYLARAAYWRYFRKQLLWPAPARYELHVVAEQAPCAGNRLSLAAERDHFGCPLLAIDWKVEAAEIATLRAYCRRFERYWQRNGLHRIGNLRWAVDFDTEGDRVTTEGGDVYHPGGTTRMGSSGATAVVDANLGTFGVANLSVASTSIFPTGASANPTLTLMLLAMRLADHLEAKFRAH
jgi:choline dehydrogenase-like flavoprotein